MKKIALLLVSIVGALAADAVEIHCTGCNAKVLPGDKFCPNCGARFEEPSYVEPPAPKPAPQYQPPSPKPKADQSEYWNEVENHKPGHALPVPMGMLRGLAEIACSPIEFCRAMVGIERSVWETEIERDGNPFSFVWWSAVATPVGTGVMGSVGVVLDAGMGVLDVVSLGTLGNVFWDNDRQSPYVFQRDWLMSGAGTRGVWY